MKTLSVRQPWATLLVSGIKDIENRTWAPRYTGRILIHASSAAVPKRFLEQEIFEIGNIISNEQLFGNIPGFEEMERSAIIGYVTVTGDTSETTSIWAEPVDHQWKIADAYIFDKPITNVKGKLNLFETPDIDESNLPPAHRLERRKPRLEGDCLVMPITDIDLEEALETKHLRVGVTDEVCDLVEIGSEEYHEGHSVFKPISTIRFESPTQKRTFNVAEISYQNLMHADGTLQKTIDWNYEEMDYFELGFTLKGEE